MAQEKGAGVFNGKLYQDEGRISWIDFVKGIAMLLVVIGHTVSNHVVRGAIFSFHIPLFFLLSGMTMRFTNTDSFTQQVNKYFHSLILPAFWMFVMEKAVELIENVWKGTFCVTDYLINLLTSLVWCSGAPFRIGKWNISAIGMPWFLVVLFFDKLFVLTLLRMTYKRSRNYQISFCCILLTASLICGWMLGKYKIWLPFSMDLTFFSMSYLFIGHSIGHCKKNILTFRPRNGFALCGVIWAVTLCFQAIFGNGYFELAIRKYTLFPVCYICSIAGAMAVCYYSQILKSDTMIFQFIEIIGRHSLLLMFIHNADYWYRSWFIHLCNNDIILTLFRLLTDVGALYLALYCKRCWNK